MVRVLRKLGDFYVFLTVARAAAIPLMRALGECGGEEWAGKTPHGRGMGSRAFFATSRRLLSASKWSGGVGSRATRPAHGRMKNGMLIMGVILFLSVNNAPGQGRQTNDLDPAGKWQADGVGSGGFEQYSVEPPSAATVRQNGRVGTGPDVNYFFIRNRGEQLDVGSETTSGALTDGLRAKGPRFHPLSQSGLSPYDFGGGDYPVEEGSKRFLQTGAGFEYRFNLHSGLFVDARRAPPNQTKFFGVARLGMRFAF